MFERFSDQSRRVLVLAQEEARQLRHDFIGTEHLLLGLLSEANSIAAHSLEEVGVSLTAMRDVVRQRIGTTGSRSLPSPPFTPRAKKTLELALREALQMGHSYIGPEHILLGLIREDHGVAYQVLVASGIDISQLRRETLRSMAVDLPGEDITESPPGPTRLRGLLAHPELDDLDPYRLLERLWSTGMVRQPVTPREQSLWQKLTEEFGPTPGMGRPTTRPTGLAEAVTANVDLGVVFNAHRVTITGVTVQGKVDLPLDLAGSSATMVYRERLDNPDQVLVTCDVLQDEVRYRVDPPLPAGESDQQILWAWEFSDDLGTNYGGFGNQMGARPDGSWCRTVGARIPADASWLEVRYPVGDPDDSIHWEWHRAHVPLADQTNLQSEIV